MNLYGPSTCALIFVQLYTTLSQKYTIYVHCLQTCNLSVRAVVQQEEK